MAVKYNYNNPIDNGIKIPTLSYEQFHKLISKEDIYELFKEVYEIK